MLNQKGISIVEVMVALGIGAVTLYLTSLQTSQIAKDLDKNKMFQEANKVSQRIRDDLYHVGSCSLTFEGVVIDPAVPLTGTVNKIKVAVEDEDLVSEYKESETLGLQVGDEVSGFRFSNLTYRLGDNISSNFRTYFLEINYELTNLKNSKLYSFPPVKTIVQLDASNRVEGCLGHENNTLLIQRHCEVASAGYNTYDYETGECKANDKILHVGEDHRTAKCPQYYEPESFSKEACKAMPPDNWNEIWHTIDTGLTADRGYENGSSVLLAPSFYTTTLNEDASCTCYYTTTIESGNLSLFKCALRCVRRPGTEHLTAESDSSGG